MIETWQQNFYLIIGGQVPDPLQYPNVAIGVLYVKKNTEKLLKAIIMCSD